MKSDLWQSCPLQDPVQHLEDAIREDRSACQRREHVLIAAAFLFLLFQDSYRISSQRDGSVGIFCFQRGLYHFFVDPGDLPLNPEDALLQIKVLPFQAEEFSPPQTRSQLNVVHLEHTAFLRLPQEAGQLLHWERLHLPMLQLWQGTAVCRIDCY